MHSKLAHIEDPGAADASFMAVERRLFRLSCVAVALMVTFSLPVAPWRVTSGLFVGGLLSLFNYHWLKTSIIVAFKGSASEGGRPKFSIWRYVTRYFIIGLILFALNWLGLISLVAALFGLCSFVAALLAEGLMQIILIIFRREEY